MKIALLSDLHIEFGSEVPFIDPRVTLIILAGDIHRHTRCIDVADVFYARHQVPVIVLAGNHEYYRSDLDGMLARIRKRALNSYGVHFLENDSVVFDRVRFLGCTLWSNFSINGSENTRDNMRIAQQCIADFQCILFRGKPFSPNNAVDIYKESYAWLESELQKPFDGKTVVVTHFAPHHAAIHPRYLQSGMDDLTPYFTTDCSALMQKYSIDAWLYGHTHNSVDVIVEGKTRLISNQAGYPNEPLEYTNFNDGKLIEL